MTSIISTGRKNIFFTQHIVKNLGALYQENTFDMQLQCNSEKYDGNLFIQSNEINDQSTLHGTNMGPSHHDHAKLFAHLYIRSLFSRHLLKCLLNIVILSHSTNISDHVPDITLCVRNFPLISPVRFLPVTLSIYPLFCISEHEKKILTISGLEHQGLPFHQLS